MEERWGWISVRDVNEGVKTFRFERNKRGGKWDGTGERNGERDGKETVTGRERMGIVRGNGEDLLVEEWGNYFD